MGSDGLPTTLIFVQELYATAKSLAGDPQHNAGLFDDVNQILGRLGSANKPGL